VSNDEFLTALLRDRTPTDLIFTASFPDPPESAQANWSFNPFTHPDSNNFYCVSTLSDPTRRTPANCTALHVLVVDDVGQKTPPEQVEAILGDPTYVIETSFGSQHWGYRLSPPASDPAVAEGLVQGLARAFTSDMSGRNRLARLPVGRNTKKGKGNVQTDLLTWEPELAISPEEALQRLNAAPVAPAPLQEQPYLPPDQDPVIQRLAYWEPTREPNVYKILCPWFESHTDQRTDGTAYIAPAGFKCWHAHCADRTFADFRAVLGLSAQEVDQAIVKATLFANPEPGPSAPLTRPRESETRHPSDEWVELDPAPNLRGRPVAPVSVPVDDPHVNPRKPHPWHKATLAHLFKGEQMELVSQEELDRMFPRRWLFKDLVPMATPWTIAGEGGIGKSRIGLALCMSIATGVPIGEFVPEQQDGALAVFLTQEDSEADKLHRSRAQLDFMSRHDKRWADPQIRRRLQQNLYVPAIEFGTSLDEAFRLGMKQFLRERGPLRVGIFDPLIAFWSHEDDRTNVNSAGGVVKTFKEMIDAVRHPDREHRDDWSLGMLHHTNKEGGVYGSVMIQAHSRMLFSLTQPDPNESRVRLEVLKANGSNTRGRQYDWTTDPSSTAVYPVARLGDQTTSEKLAVAIHNGHLNWDQPLSKLEEKAKLLPTIGPNDDVTATLLTWHKSTPGSAEVLRPLGLVHSPYNRYQPVLGFGMAEATSFIEDDTNEGEGSEEGTSE